MPDELTYEEQAERIRELEARVSGLPRLKDRLQQTDRQLDELREQIDIFQALMDEIQIVTFSVDAGLELQSISNAVETITGFTPSEVQGRKITDLIFPEDLDLVMSAYQRLLDGDVGASEYRVVRKNGGFSWVRSLSRRLMKEDRFQGFFGILVNLTDQKKAEESFQESETRYRNIVESIREGYYEVDLKGDFIFVNQAICDAMGFDRPRLMGANYRDYTSPATFEKMYRIFSDVYQTGLDSEVNEFEIVTMDGRTLLAELAASAIRNDDGEISGFRGIVRDITGRVKAMEDRKKLENQLHQAQKMEAIGTLAGGIAHDFNNILMGIQGNTSLMLLNMPPEHPHHEKLKNIEDYIQGGSGLTRQLLTFARRERYESKPTNVNHLLEQTARMFGRTKKEIHIRSKFEPDIWSVEADQGQISQVLLNLFVNAWQAMPDGGDLFLETRNVELDENQVRGFHLAPGRFVKMAVTDTGIGMKEDVRLRIFDPFFTTKEMGRGTGLGLASAYGIIKNHGGMITVYSEEGQGTTFNIYLPVSDKKVVAEEKKINQILTGSETILFVDDEISIMNLGQEILETLGYTVLTVRSGEEALQVYKEHIKEVSLVILDMIMPDMNGSEAFDRLKEINPDIRVLLSSGYSVNGQAGEIMSRGCAGFIQKPFNLIELSRKIREILDA